MGNDEPKLRDQVLKMQLLQESDFDKKFRWKNAAADGNSWYAKNVSQEEVIIDEWFALPSHFKIYNGSAFIPEDDVNLYQSQSPRPFIPTDDYVEECIRCLNDTKGPSNVWWSPLHTIEMIEVTIQPGFCLTPKDLRRQHRQPMIGHYVCAEWELCLLSFWPFV
jgi:hypothetical protein